MLLALLFAFQAVWTSGLVLNNLFNENISKMQLRSQTLQGAYFKGKAQIGFSLREHILFIVFLQPVV